LLQFETVFKEKGLESGEVMLANKLSAVILDLEFDDILPTETYKYPMHRELRDKCAILWGESKDMKDYVDGLVILMQGCD
jgi:hypothetical protein